MHFPFRFCQKQYLFTFRCGFFVLCITFVGVLTFLGVWQLKRYHFKQNLLHAIQESQKRSPTPFDSKATFEPFEKVTVEGQYLTALTMLVQNQLYQGQAGFEILTPLALKGEKKRLLVDRGWAATSQKALVATNLFDNQPIIGNIKFLNEYHFILGKNILHPETKPIIMQKIDFNELHNITGEQFYPFILQLAAATDDLTHQEWVTNIVPERHFAYAVQWFTMAGILILAYLFFCCERIEETENA